VRPGRGGEARRDRLHQVDRKRPVRQRRVKPEQGDLIGPIVGRFFASGKFLKIELPKFLGNFNFRNVKYSHFG
jgi:hypothetical protein